LYQAIFAGYCASVPYTAMMQKDFDKWNETKKKIHDRINTPFFNEREVWWCVLGRNIGVEQDGGESI
jgi:hypothetical protein